MGLTDMLQFDSLRLPYWAWLIVFVSLFVLAIEAFIPWIRRIRSLEMWLLKLWWKLHGTWPIAISMRKCEVSERHYLNNPSAEYSVHVSFVLTPRERCKAKLLMMVGSNGQRVDPQIDPTEYGRFGGNPWEIGFEIDMPETMSAYFIFPEKPNKVRLEVEGHGIVCRSKESLCTTVIQ